MRSNPANFELIAPPSLDEALHLLADVPGKWAPIAGGTEIMVQFGAGKLSHHRFISIQALPELRKITSTDTELHIGAACTYTNLRSNPIVSEEFPLLSTAASWTGSIANQNRGTLGGNIVNASPAADSLPALLVYEADLILISTQGKRRIPYVNFHTGYKQTCLKPDELIFSIVLPRRYSDYFTYCRKVGPRNAQAISKLCIAAIAKTNGTTIETVRIAMGGVAPTPLRLRNTEATLINETLSSIVIQKARAALESEIAPIDDLRSTRAYRLAVAANVLEEFIRRLQSRSEASTLQNLQLAKWNSSPFKSAVTDLLSCCACSAWAEQISSTRPYANFEELLSAAKAVWRNLDSQHWLEAFRGHPRIGQRQAENARSETSLALSATEQQSVHQADAEIKRAIADGNRLYEQRFGRIFIIFASGKSPEEILFDLQRRLANTNEKELEESVAQQEHIFSLRLRNWLTSRRDL